MLLVPRGVRVVRVVRVVLPVDDGRDCRVDDPDDGFFLCFPYIYFFLSLS